MADNTQNNNGNVDGRPSSTDLPFLVTHWLSQYNYSGEENGNPAGHHGTSTSTSTSEETQLDALDRIRKATNELASAFADLGAFGVNLVNPLGGTVDTGSSGSNSILRNANYTDVSRRWENVPRGHLQSLVTSSSAVSSAAWNHAQSLNRREHQSLSMLDTAYERDTNAASGSHSDVQQQNHHEHHAQSAMQLPVLIEYPNASTNEANDEISEPDAVMGVGVSSNAKKLSLALGSDYKRLETLAAQALRRYLTIHAKFQDEGRTIRTISRSLTFRKRFQKQVEEEITQLLSTNSASAASAHSTAMQTTEAMNDDDDEEIQIVEPSTSDELANKKMDNERVIAQLGRRLSEIMDTHQNQTRKDLGLAKSVLQTLQQESQSMKARYSDPTRTGNSTCGFHEGWKVHGTKSDSVLNYMIGRQYGVGVKQGRGTKGSLRRQIGMRPSHDSLKLRHKTIFPRRLSHAVTINSHLFYPVYCLRFDRTGRYFLTGADDNVVKLFKIGTVTRKKRSVYSASDYSYQRGAILVCSLRGHAGVITDIGVNSDNALLATASEDGDVRVWGMANGCPVAILRGHEGGANMVSWSPMTPYRITTVGHDGLARIWDVREAALKRCATIRDRVDYSSPSLDENEEEETRAIGDEGGDESGSDVVLPPLPARVQREGEASDPELVPAAVDQNPQENAGIFVPPLPPGAENGIGAEVVGDQNGNAGPVPGAFVANNEIDEGVTLLSRLLHGDPDVPLQGAGTRARRKKVKVICLARCPIGGHFATGSDDGIGRIWLDEDDDKIEKCDEALLDGSNNAGCIGSTTLQLQGRIRDSLRRTRGSSRGNNNAPTTRTLLAHLHGHHNDITDIEYSHMGDRLLTASQKDGVVRVWSWGTETARDYDGSLKMDQIKQIYIRMEPPSHFQQERSISNTQNSTSVPTGRRRGGTSAAQRSSVIVHCDVATWTADDTKIITSQSCVAKPKDLDILPGSHVLYVWDSQSGSCLIGLPGAHEKPCPVLLSHPHDSSTIVSAGADGVVKVWDLDMGKCIFTHQNIHKYGSLENLSERGKKCGYLDGSFSPDGLHLILTDDTGRITLVDVLGSEEGIRDSLVASESASATGNDICTDPIALREIKAPAWMQEQYFANDYYDLFYDASGYCIERGSRLPPYLAPEAARCNHTGNPFPESTQRMFTGLMGPMPTSELEVRLSRYSIRKSSVEVRRPQDGILSRNVYGKRNLVEARALKSSYLTVHPTSRAHRNRRSSSGSAANPDQGSRLNNPPRRNTQAARRQRSNNYRWLGFDDMEREIENASDEVDSDEEYEEGARLRPEDVREIWGGGTRRGGNSSARSRQRPDRNQNRNSLDELDELEEAIRRRRRRGNNNSRNRRQQNRNRAQNDVAARRQPQRSNLRYFSESSDDDALEEVIQNQPTRTSARQSQRPNRQYLSESSDDDVLEEMLSANTRPSGEYVKDYTELGHLFKLPLGGKIRRTWLSRKECILDHTGWKTYAPQVGDTVVYIPKAHSDILKAFPVCEGAAGAPWKSWPRNSSWPAVECKISKIRYRFPYNGYYGNRSRNVIHSVVAILTLELIGIPIDSSDRAMPWLHPDFVPRPSTRSSNGTFEVSLFESEETAFIIPANLYKWRLRRIEEAVLANRGNAAGVELIDFYINVREEDAQFDPYRCKVVSTAEDNENELHFQRSGYDSLEIGYDSKEFSVAPVWNFAVKGEENKCPLPTCLTEAQKKGLVEILDTLESDPDVKSIFSSPVNTNCFVDYLVMIEVPMDTSIVRDRLENKYYTNVFSTFADMKLILDNCLKYNKTGTDVSNVAIKMFERFSKLFDEKMAEVGYDPTDRHESERTFIIVPGNGLSQLESLPNEEALNDAQPRAGDIPVDLPQRLEGNSTMSRRAARAQERQMRANNDQSVAFARNPTISGRATRAQERELRANDNENVTVVADNIIAVPANNTNRSTARSRRTRQQRSMEEEESDHDVQQVPIFSSLKVIIDDEDFIDSSDTENKKQAASDSRAERQRRRSARFEDNTGGGEVLEEEKTSSQPKPRTTRIRISTRRQAIVTQQDTEDEADAKRDDSDPPRRSNRATRRSARHASISATNKSNDTEDEVDLNEDEADQDVEEESPAPPRRSNRATRQSARQASISAISTSSSVIQSSDGEGHFESDNASSVADEESPAPIRQSNRATRRSIRLTELPLENESSEEEHYSSGESSHEEEMASPRTRRAATRIAAPTQDQRPTSSNTRGRKRPHESEEEDTPPRRSLRGNTARSLDAEAFNRPTRSSTRHTASSLIMNQSSTRASRNATSSLEGLPSSPGIRESPRRKNSAVSPNYHDISNSEISEDESVHEERPRRKRARTSPPKQVAPKKSHKPKKSTAPKLPQLEKWPGHIVKGDEHLRDLCNAIMDKVEAFDAEKVFHLPVLKTHPGMEKKYLAKVGTPMDFQTIRNSCIENYRVIGDLQDDLILVFKNCCTFNRINSEYWKYAVEIWENLNKIFVDVLREEGIDLPRRFKSLGET